MAKARIQYLSEREKDFVHEKTLEVLREVGVAYNSPLAIDLLDEAGAQVDRERLTAKLSWDLIERCLATTPKEVLLAGRRPQDDRVLGRTALVTTSDGMATYVYDDLAGTRREGVAEDLASIVRLSDALPAIDVIWPSPQASDLDPRTMPLEMQAICLRNTTKHIQDEVREPELVEPILAIYEAAAGAKLTERPLFSVTNCTIAPLQHDRDMTEASLKLCRRGVPIYVLPMPQTGTTGPMSVLGTCVVHMAELLSGVVLFQLAHPGCAVIAGVGAAVAEMRSGLYLAGAPEIGLINLICIEMSKRYGLLTQATGISTDAKTCDLQAGSEGGMSGLVAALAGADSLVANGTVDSVQSESVAKLVLDCDQLGAIRRYLREDPVDEATALIDDIKEVGIGGHYLGRKSTRTFYRGGEVWQPDVFQRESFEECAGTTLVERALARADELLATHEVAPLPDDAEREIERVIARHGRHSRTE